MNCFRKPAARDVGLALLTCFGFIWMFIEPAGLFFPDSWLGQAGWAGYGGIVSLSLIGSLLWAAYQPDSATSRWGDSDVSVSVRVGDILKRSGNVIVGTNDVFDTEMPAIVSEGSLQGKFQRLAFGQDTARLDTQLEAELRRVSPVATDETKSQGKSIRYPIGTSAVIELAPTRYFLLAYAEMASDLHVAATPAGIWLSLSDLWRDVRTRGQFQPVHIPVIGSKFARTGLSRSLLIQFIIMSFILAAKSAEGPPAPQLTVWVFPDDRGNIEMRTLSRWLRYVCTRQ